MLRRIGAEEGGEFKAVASGTLPNGRPVIVNADGTVAVVGSAAQAQTIGTPTAFTSSTTVTQQALVHDSSNNKYVFVYYNGDPYHGKAIVGSVSGTSITYGSEATFNAAATYNTTSAAFDSTNNKVVIVYGDVGDSGKGKAIVGTVDGTSITFGSAVEFEAGEVEYLDIVYDANAGKVLIVYADVGNSRYGTAIVGTVSGTSISFGSPVVYLSNRSRGQTLTYDSNAQKSLLVYRDQNNTEQGRARVATISGTSVSFGTQADLGLAAWPQSSAFDSTNNKILVAYRSEESGSGNRAELKVATISGTSVSFGSATIVRSSNTGNLSVAYDSANEVFVVLYGATADLKTATISGTNVTLSSEISYDTAGQVNTPPGRGVVYKDGVGFVIFTQKSSVGTGTVFRPAGNYLNLTSENYIGMSRGVAVPSSAGTKSVYESASAPNTAIVYDSNSDKIVIAYRDNGNSNYGTAVVGTVSGSSITFGTPVIFDSSETISTSLDTAFDSTNNKIVVAYKSNAAAGKAVVGTVSGTSISFGSVVQFDSATVASYIAATFDSSNGKVLICYGKSNTGKAVVGTVSGTSISFGSIAQFESGETVNISAGFDSSNNKVVIGYVDSGNNTYGTAVVGTISGTSVTFGTPVVFETATCGETSTVFDSNNNKVVISYVGGSNYGKSIVGTVSGTSISFGSAATFKAQTVNYVSSTFDSTKGQVVCLYNDSSGSPYNTLSKSGTVSGTSISFGGESVVTGQAYSFKVTHDPDNGINVAAFQDADNSYYGTAVAFNNETRGEVADGSQASIDIIGSVSDNQGSLTAGQQYFVQTDGTISTTADSPSVLAGTAISATELVVKT
jgi:hypothetical protein